MQILLQVSFLPRDSGNAGLQEEARKLGLEPRYIYRVTQVPPPYLALKFPPILYLSFMESLRWPTWVKAGR